MKLTTFRDFKRTKIFLMYTIGAKLKKLAFLILEQRIMNQALSWGSRPESAPNLSVGTPSAVATSA